MISEGKYWEALKSFKERICYCPLLNDNIVPYETAAIS